MKKVLTVGGATQDIFTQYEKVETLSLCSDDINASYLIMRAGRKIEVDQLLYYCGGGAANSAVSFAYAGYSVEAFFKIGADNAGDFILELLQSQNVSTYHAIRTQSAPTGSSFIVPGPEGNRSVLVYRGANATLNESELPASAINQADQLYITSLSGDSADILLPLVVMAKKYNKKIAVNPGTSQLRSGALLFQQALSYIDILIVNAYEAQLLMASLLNEKLDISAAHKKTEDIPELLSRSVGSPVACFLLKQFFQEMHHRGPSIVVVTNGAEGVYVSDKERIFFHPSIKTHIVSTIGGGDAFGSTFVASLLRNKSIEDSLRAGIINSASVIAHLGTQSGLLDAKEIDHRVSQLDKNLIQIYQF